MSASAPKIVFAGSREAGALCAHCGLELQRGEDAALCGDCGAVHHRTCWERQGGCGSYECAQSGAYSAPRPLEKLSISRAELASVEPWSPPPRVTSYEPPPEPPRTWNRIAIWAFVVAVLGIPLFGLVTGLVAILIACVALVGHSSRRKGLAFAVLAILLGLVDVVGWAIGLSHYFDSGAAMVALDDLKLDPKALDDLPERLSRAMRANVLIESNFGLPGRGIGSGVILKIRDGLAYIVTNRHVVDHHFSEGPGDAAAPADLKDMAKLNVTTVGQTRAAGAVEWVAPHGVDLAIVSVPLLGAAEQVREAWWDAKKTPHIGDQVFAVGNPHGLGWTHSAGSISQVRDRTKDQYEFRVLQTTAAINPGNSGGGLYDADGRLVGINTMTGDKRVAEGLSFSIAFPTLLDLIPDTFKLESANGKERAE
jgi:hypothetical protein